MGREVNSFRLSLDEQGAEAADRVDGTVAKDRRPYTGAAQGQPAQEDACDEGEPDHQQHAYP